MEVIKRNGQKVKYDGYKIVKAISKAMQEVKGEVNKEICHQIEQDIYNNLKQGNYKATVEGIQDAVEDSLMSLGNYNDVAKAYILYRNKRALEREKPHKYKYLSKEFLSKYSREPNPFPEELGTVVYKRTYARPIPEEHRREDWWETVARVVEFNTDLEILARQRQGRPITEELKSDLIDTAERMYHHIYTLGLFPSGRSLWVGGTPASYQYPISNFNCSFITIDNFQKFGEMFFVLMLGTGVGLSVERQYINKLPRVNTDLRVVHQHYAPEKKEDRLEFTELIEVSKNVLKINVGDSKYGWAKAMSIYLDIISNVQYKDIEILLINYDSVRPKGEPLKTFGGYASGHENLKTMFEKIDKLFQEMPNGWHYIKPIHALDIATIIAENVISGGVRRSALIIFTDEDEKDVIEAKSNLYTQSNGEWSVNLDIVHRQLSNNTIKYYKKPTRPQLEWHINTMKNTGEPAFLNMEEVLRRREDAEGGNPCMEILLRDRGVCNLTEINMANFVDEAGHIDFPGMYEAQRLSAIIGYRMASTELEIHSWDMVNKEDRLVGCSLTGITDFVQKSNISIADMRAIFRRLREIATDTANTLADELGMNRPKLVTTIKPSGTVSQLPTVASGLHFNHSKYYIRRVRVSTDDPIAKALVDMGYTWYPEVGETEENHSTKVFEFPVQAPGKIFKADAGAIEQLEWYKLIMEEYVDHNASITVHVKDDEWEDVTDWLDNNWDSVVGISFLPYDGGVYELAPYEEITEAEYNKLVEITPTFDSRAVDKYEVFGVEFDVLDTACESGFCPVR